MATQLSNLAAIILESSTYKVQFMPSATSAICSPKLHACAWCLFNVIREILMRVNIGTPVALCGCYTPLPIPILPALSPSLTSSSAGKPRRLLAVVLWLSLLSLGGATPPTPPSPAAHAATPADIGADRGSGLLTVGPVKIAESRSRVGLALLVSGLATSELLLSRRLARSARSSARTR